MGCDQLLQSIGFFYLWDCRNIRGMLKIDLSIIKILCYEHLASFAGVSKLHLRMTSSYN